MALVCITHKVPLVLITGLVGPINLGNDCVEMHKQLNKILRGLTFKQLLSFDWNAVQCFPGK